jgi:uncharacterized protein (UPF0332 family)
MDLKSQIEFYKRKLLLRETKVEKILAGSYLRKARNNIIAMQVDYKVSENEEVKKLINISGFKEYDWVVVKGYYAMYMASLACLAKLDLKSENHNATIFALEFYFVEKGKLERNYLEILKNVFLEKEYVDSLKGAKDDRITAQYNVSEEFEKRKAEEMIENAKKFVDRMEKLFYEIARGEEKTRKEEERKKRAEEERKKGKSSAKLGKVRQNEKKKEEQVS